MSKKRFRLKDIQDCDAHKEDSFWGERTNLPLFMNRIKNLRVEDNLIVGETAFFCSLCKKCLKKGTFIYMDAPLCCPFCMGMDFSVNKYWGRPLEIQCNYCGKIAYYYKEDSVDRTIWE